MKVLFLVPSFSLIGGVANHYLGLHDYWTENIKYCFLGHRHGIPAFFWLIPDYFIFLFKIILFRPQLIVINPSFRIYMLYRDGVYLLLAKLMRKKVVCFMHGWDISLANKVEKNPSFYNMVFGQADLTYVLCKDYLEQLQRMNFNSKVKLTTTKVDDKLLSNFNVRIRNRKITNLLYLARVSKSKGIFIALDAYEELKKQYPYMKFTVVGNGDDLVAAQDYVKINGINDVTFTGGVTGKLLSEQFESGDIYILPTYFEGMATSVLEAMAFGLPIITTPTGGVKDFFQEGKMGYLIDTYNAKDYCLAITKLLDNPGLYMNIVYYNYEYALKHFMASEVAERMENDFRKL